MSDCDAPRRLISPYLDGELVGEDRAAFEAHLAKCAPCRRALEEEAAIVSAVAAVHPRFEAPAALRERVDLLFERAASTSSARRWRAPWRLALAAGFVIAAFGAASLLRSSPPPPVWSAPPTQDFVGRAVDSHLRYTRGQLPLEVASDRPEEVSRWFRGRVPFHLTLPDYPVLPGEQKFYRLEGGRLVSFRDDYVAYAVYRMDERPISLLVTSSERVRPEGGDTVTFGKLDFHLESRAGLKVITWSDNGLTYALVSDLTVSGSASCLVCHGSPEERRRIEGFSTSPVG